MRKSIALLFFFVLPLLAQEAVQQLAPPPPAPPREVRVPQPVETTLANGLRVIVVPDHDIPLVAARLMIKTGAAADPKGRDGLAQLTAAVLTKGTKTRTAEQLARGVEALGATVEAQAGWDTSAINLSVMSSNLAKAMPFVADVARNATFAADELERERAQALDALQVTLQDPGSVASIVAQKLVFGDSPYGHNLEGLPSTLETIKREDLLAFHRAHYRPDNAALILAGDIKADAAFALAKELFGTWKSSAAAKAAALSTEVKFPAPRVVVIDMPEAGQSAVVIARPGIRRADASFTQAEVANAVLGGGYSSRLNQEIRIKRGLSYGAGSGFAARAHVGPFVASTETKHESAAEVAGIIAGEMSKLSVAAVPEVELAPRKATLLGDFAFSLETTAGVVSTLAALARHDLPLNDISRYTGRVQAVTADEVRTFATANLATTPASVVVAGDAKAFLEPLRMQYPAVEVIKLEELDLAAPVLRVRKAKG